jgi:putative phosphoribosyl transferase
MTFRDRRQAGVRLAARLSRLRDERPFVLALPRGGVPVAFEVARALAAPLDVLVVRKVAAPWHRELGLGAVAEGGVTLLDEAVVRSIGITRPELGEVLAEQRAEVTRRMARYRAGRPLPDLSDRTVVLVDDGVAMGGTMRAAVAAMRGRCRRVVVAVPVAAAESVDVLREEADEVIALEQPERMTAIGWWYGAFDQVQDEEVLALLAAARAEIPRTSALVTIRVGGANLQADLDMPDALRGIVIFAHGSGSSRFSPRNRQVARTLRQAGFATLLLDLLTPEEDEYDAVTREIRFDVMLLARRVIAAIDWTLHTPAFRGLPIGLFGASTGAAAALIAAVLRPEHVGAIVARGGRPDLAGTLLRRVSSPTLLVVGGLDEEVLELNRVALDLLSGPKRLEIVPDATHLFEEQGALEAVARLSADWFTACLDEEVRRETPHHPHDRLGLAGDAR